MVAGGAVEGALHWVDEEAEFGCGLANLGGKGQFGSKGLFAGFVSDEFDSHQ